MARDIFTVHGGRKMTVIDLNKERRGKRSNKAHIAISYQLEHIFENQDLSNFVLGDSSGLLLAGAGDSEEADVLAAYAPVLETYRGKSRGKVFAKLASMVPRFNPSALSIRSFQIDGETLYLLSVGRKRTARQASLYRAVTGIRRILEQTAVAA
jgi:hypothetical protein